MRVHVAFTPAEAAGAPVGIVVDVLRATSTIAQALASGYERVYCSAESTTRWLSGAARRGAARRRAERRQDRGLRRRRLSAGVPGRAAREDGDLLDDERDARDPRDRGALGGGAARKPAQPRCRAAAARERGEDVAVICAGFQGQFASTTPTAPAGSSSSWAASRRTRRRRPRRSRCVAGRARGPPRPHVRPARPGGGHRFLRAGGNSRRRAPAVADGRRRGGDQRGRLTAPGACSVTCPRARQHGSRPVHGRRRRGGDRLLHDAFRLRGLDGLCARVRRRAARQPPTAPQRPVELGRTAHAGRKAAGARRLEPHPFLVDDLEAEVERLRASGLTFRNDIVKGPGGSQILVDDPAGNPIELFQPR